MMRLHCDDSEQSLTGRLLMVDWSLDTNRGVPGSGTPDDDFKLPLALHRHDDLTVAGSCRPRPRAKHPAQAGSASMRTEWPRGKKWTVPARRSADKLHKTLKLSLATGSGEAKPKRQVDRDYSQPGKFRGVRYHAKGRYSAELKVKEVRRWLGVFATAEEAARAFDRAAFEVRGKEARLNFPELIEGAEPHHRRHRHRRTGLHRDTEEEDGHGGDGDEDGNLDLNCDAKKGGNREDATDHDSEPLHCDKGRRGSGDDAADGQPGCLEPTSPLSQRSYDGFIIQQGSPCTRRVKLELEDANVWGGGLGPYQDTGTDSLEVGGRESTATPAAGAKTTQQLQDHLPSHHPQAGMNTDVFSDNNTMAGSDTIVCASPPLLPPNSSCVHPHTWHPLTARPPLWPDLNADPLEHLPSSLSLSAPEADSVTVAQAQGIMDEQQQHQQQQQQQIPNNWMDARLLPSEPMGEAATNPDVMQMQSPLAMQQGESLWTAGTGTANGGSSRTSNGPVFATVDAHAAAASDRLLGGSSSGDLNPLDPSSDGCIAKPR